MVFTSKMFEKRLWKSDFLSKDAGRRPASLLKMSLFHWRFFKHFASKNQVPGLSVSGTLFENGLIRNCPKEIVDVAITSVSIFYERANSEKFWGNLVNL